MTVASSRTRRQRGALDAEVILDAAFEVAANSDLDLMSVPEVAAHLGVGVSSVYWHFRRKDDLLRAMSDRAVRTVQEALPRPGETGEWQDFLQAYFTRLRELYRADETLADLTLVRIRSYSLDSTHYLYEQYEHVLDYLVGCGFDELEAWRCFSTAYTFTRGVVIGERTQRLNNSPILDSRQSKLVVPERMPRLTRLVHDEGIMLAMVDDADFEFGLALVLEAVARRHPHG